MKLRKLFARPRPPRAGGRRGRGVQESFPARLEAIAREKAVNRIGQADKLTRRWAKRGTRPCAPQDRRTASTCIFGAACPKEGKGVALVMPWRNTQAMAQHLAATPEKVEPGRHAALLLGRAGWRMSARLVVPEPRRSRCGFADIAIVRLRRNVLN